MPNKRTESKNIYSLPFDELLNLKPQPAPFHYEVKWQKHALDFAMKEGTPIRAALDGIVIKAIDEFGPGGPEKSFVDSCNLLIIEHINGEYSGYAYLRKGFKVREDDEVKEGSIIAYSGRSGYNTYQHLHFNVMKKTKSDNWQTIPTRFKLKNGIYVLTSPIE
ncbi:M23 family metallopeptidase [Candidatus Woesearchaeota archaeon]|nr:M23 family metallopeptidase [Candidatus Woesearchaeota archaeon]